MSLKTLLLEKQENWEVVAEVVVVGDVVEAEVGADRVEAVINPQTTTLEGWGVPTTIMEFKLIIRKGKTASRMIWIVKVQESGFLCSR